MSSEAFLKIMTERVARGHYFLERRFSPQIQNADSERRFRTPIQNADSDSSPQFVMNLSHGAILVAWELMSILKTAKGVSFERVSASHPFECITLPIFPRFHACIKICSFLICFCVMLL